MIPLNRRRPKSMPSKENWLTTKRYSTPTDPRVSEKTMSGKHDHKPFEGHMHDFEAHIRAVEEDLVYYLAKRFQPRIFYLMRRGVVAFYDLLKARVPLKRVDQLFKLKKPQGKSIEARVRYLREWV